jgi:hypothetical protein
MRVGEKAILQGSHMICGTTQPWSFAKEMRGEAERILVPP